MSEAEATPAKTIIVPAEIGGTKFTDTMDIDQAAHRLFMGDNWSYGVDVFDIATPTPRYEKTIRSIHMRPAAFFGLCVAHELSKVFVAHGTSLVSVIDTDPKSPTFDTVVATVRTGGLGMADLIDYDPLHQKIYVGNRDEGFMTSIDAVTNQLVARIDGLGRGLEQPRYNPADGMVYVVSNVDNVIHQVDPTRDQLMHSFEIGDDCSPNGLAINPTTNQALLGCDNDRSPHLIIWDLSAHRISSVLDGCGCGDGAIYDPVVDRYFFAASGFPSGPVVSIIDGGSATLVANVATGPGASWVAFDQTNKVLYTPAIEDGKPALLYFGLGS
jgi:DNA-binding beta-propeller fold protein YncE